MNQACPLCGGYQLSVFSHQAWQSKSAESHFLCGTCDLIFLRPELRLDSAQEKARYDLHENSSEDQGYKNFLQPVVDLCEKLYGADVRAGLRVLDFGCGPHPVLAQWLGELGFELSLYDAFYRTDAEIFAQKFDLVVSTEVFEHLYQPALELERLRRMINEPAGTLLVMTQLHQGTEHFKNWWYASDPSHVVFYSKQSVQWIQKKFQFPRLFVVSGKTVLQV